MNRISLIMAGVLATVIASLFGLVLIPDMQFDQMQPKEIMAADGSTAMYPAPLSDFREAPGKEPDPSLGKPLIRLPESYASEPTWIVPDERAMSLVAYLKSLAQRYDLEDVQ